MIGFTISVTAMLAASAMAEQWVVPTLDTMMNNTYIASGVLAAVDAARLIGAVVSHRREQGNVARYEPIIYTDADGSSYYNGLHGRRAVNY